MHQFSFSIRWAHDHIIRKILRERYRPTYITGQVEGHRALEPINEDLAELLVLAE